MPKSFKQLSDLLLHVQILVDPDGDLQPPELTAVAYAISALPSGEYCVYDDQQDTSPVWLEMIPATTISDWSGSHPKSMGYGGIARMEFQQGVGLRIWLAGSSMSPASGLTIVPVAALHIVGL